MPPARTGAVSLLGAIVLLVLAGLVAALAASLITGLRVLVYGGSFGDATGALTRDALVLALVQLLGLVVATGVGVMAAFGAEVRYRDALAVEPSPAAIVVLALSAGLALQLPLHELANLVAAIHPSLGMDAEQQARMRELVHIDGWQEAIFVPIAVVAIPAVSEELLFRGLLLPGLARRYGPRLALFTSAGLFGLIHVVPVAIVYATVAGVALGWLRQRSGSVLPCIAMHGAFNAVPILLPAELIRIEGFNTVGDGLYHLPLPLVLGSAAVAGLSIYAMARLMDAPET